jgi:hypothetical protein
MAREGQVTDSSDKLFHSLWGWMEPYNALAHDKYIFFLGIYFLVWNPIIFWKTWEQSSSIAAAKAQRNSPLSKLSFNK